MDLSRFVEAVSQRVAASSEGADHAHQAVAARLVSSLDAALRLSLLDALGAATSEISAELAPGSVELRLRDGQPEFVVTAPPAEWELSQEGSEPTDAPVRVAAADEGDPTRINLRLPSGLKARVEQAADADGLSINAWLVRSTAAALEPTRRPAPPASRAPRTRQRYTGWAR